MTTVISTVRSTVQGTIADIGGGGAKVIFSQAADMTVDGWTVIDGTPKLTELGGYLELENGTAVNAQIRKPLMYETGKMIHLTITGGPVSTSQIRVNDGVGLILNTSIGNGVVFQQSFEALGPSGYIQLGAGSATLSRTVSWTDTLIVIEED